VSDDYIHPNDPSNPDCLEPIVPDGAASTVSPIEAALWERSIPTWRLTNGMIVCRGLYITLWPSREGTYGVASGSQYALRRRDGGHDDHKSVEAALSHPWLQRGAEKPTAYIGEGW
jgi:hypothetical protein